MDLHDACCLWTYRLRLRLRPEGAMPYDIAFGFFNRARGIVCLVMDVSRKSYSSYCDGVASPLLLELTHNPGIWHPASMDSASLLLPKKAVLSPRRRSGGQTKQRTVVQIQININREATRGSENRVTSEAQHGEGRCSSYHVGVIELLVD